MPPVIFLKKVIGGTYLTGDFPRKSYQGPMPSVIFFRKSPTRYVSPMNFSRKSTSDQGHWLHKISDKQGRGNSPARSMSLENFPIHRWPMPPVHFLGKRHWLHLPSVMFLGKYIDGISHRWAPRDTPTANVIGMFTKESKMAYVVNVLLRTSPANFVASEFSLGTTPMANAAGIFSWEHHQWQMPMVMFYIKVSSGKGCWKPVTEIKK